MKKYFYIILAAAALVASCTKVDLKEDQKLELQDGKTGLFSGSIIQPNGLNGGKTKVSVAGESNENVGIWWDEDDEIIVYPQNSSDWKYFWAQSSGANAHFSRTSDASVAKWLADYDSIGYEAYYPSDTADEQIADKDEGPQSGWALRCDAKAENNQASLENMPLYGVCEPGSIETAENKRPLTFRSNYAILKIGVPGGKGIEAMEVCVNAASSPAVTVTNIDTLTVERDSVIYVPVLPLAGGIQKLTFTAYGDGYYDAGTKETSKIAVMETYFNAGNLPLEANTIYSFDFCNTLTISSQGTYNLDEKFKNDLDCRINISENIDAVAIYATKADKIFVNVRNREVGTLEIDAPNSHVEVENGKATSINAKTSNRTFVAKKDFTVTNLTVEKGSVVVEGLENGNANVTNIVIPANAEGHISIDVRGVTSSTNEVTINNQKGVGVSVSATESEKGYELAQGSEDVQEIISGDDTYNFVAQIGDATYLTLADAIVDVRPGETIKLVKNVEKANGISVPSGKNFTVDFGGFTFTCASEPAGSTNTKNQVFQLLKDSDITFKNGKIAVADTAKTKFRFIIQNYANLTLEDMTLDGTNLALNDGRNLDNYTISNNYGTIEFNGKTNIYAAAQNGVAFDVCKDSQTSTYPTAATVTWNSTGSVKGIIELSGGDFVVKSNLKVTTPIRANSGASTMTVDAGVVVSPVDEGFGKAVKTKYTDKSDETQKGVVVVNRGGDLTINGNGKIAATTNYAAVSLTEKGEDDATNAAKLTVDENVTLEGKYYGIVGNGNRHNTEITVNDGTIKGLAENNNAGIYHPQNGTLTINGGTIEGAVGIYVKSGTVTTAIDGGIIKGVGAKKDYQTTGDGFEATGDAIVFDNCDYPGGEPNATINGGTFISTNGKAVASYAKNGKDPISPVINGGKFSDMSGVNYVADSGTYTLANDVNLGTEFLEINSGKTFTVDLGKKTLTGRTNITCGNVTFENGTIKGITGDVDAKYKQPLNVYGSSETTATQYSVLTIASDVTVTADVYGVSVFGKTAGTTGYGAVVNISGKINTTGDAKNGAVFVSGNLGKGETTEWAVSTKNAVNILSGAEITSATDAAIALNGSATVTVGDSTKVTGATAIAAKRGKLVVNGGTITGTKNPGNSKPDAYFNGTEMTGSAVSATATYKNDGPLSVEIKGGTFTSKAYTILNNHDECTFQISGGNFDTQMDTDGVTVYARLGSVNITNGNFANNSNSEATLHVGCPTANEGGFEPKLTISGDKTVVKNNANGPYTYKTSWAPLCVNMENKLTYKAVTITGGEFYGQKPECDDNVTGENGKFVDMNSFDITDYGQNHYAVSAKSQQN